MNFRDFRFYKTLFTFFSLSILITLSCKKEETPITPSNNKPEIEELIIDSDSILVNSSKVLTCKTSDKDGDDIKITWLAKSGSFKEGNSDENVRYFSSSFTGKDTVTLIVDDGKEKTEREIELYIGDKPQKPNLMSPENHKTEIELSVLLTWKKQGDATGYNLQVATDKHFKNFLFSRYGINQNKYFLTGLNINTTYYWRVRSKNKFGYSGWSQIFYFTTVAPPHIPDIVVPDNNSLNVEINPVIRWRKIFNANTYSFQLSNSETFESILINKTGLIDTLFQVGGLDYFKDYFCRVSSKNSYGESGWSTTYKFTTTGRAPFPPELLSPSNNQTNVHHTIKLIWNKSDYAESYSIQVAGDSLFNTIIYDSLAISTTSFELTNLGNTKKYFWRVKAANIFGSSQWSDSFSFLTKLTEPEITYPFDNSADIAPTTILNWTKIDKAETYSIEVSSDSTFSKIFYSEKGIKDTSAQVGGLNTFTKYYWRVRSENNLATSSWSSVKTFNVTGYFYKGYDYGNQAVYHPIYVLLSGGFDMIQVGDKRDIKNFPYKIAAKNIWKNLSDPFKPIGRYGWWNFIKDQVLPLSLSKQNAQFFPNYTLHLIGGGMEYAALKEWYEYNNYSAPGWLSAATVMGYHLVNEIAENGNYVGDDVDPIADIYIFDIGGILLFTSESVKRFFAEDLNLADWSQQPAFSIRNGELHNNGQFFSIRWKFPFTDSWYAFYYFGTNGVGGLSYKFKDGTGLSVGFGLRASDLILLDEKTNKKTLGLVGNLGLFYDKNNSLLASLSVTIKTDYMVNVNVYPGLIKIGSLSPGLWGAYGQNGNVILGFTFSWLPFGFAQSFR